MKLTKKQRGEIYLKAAERFLNGNNLNNGLCDELLNVKGNRTAKTHFSKSLDWFDEFALFHPGYCLPSYSFWFDNSPERITCMLLCYEMCQQ